MEELFDVLIVIVVILFVVIRAAKTKTVENKRTVQTPKKIPASAQKDTQFQVNVPAKGTPKTSGVANSMRGGTVGSANINKGNSSIKAVSKVMEDRDHDWLARQLAEEKNALYRMSDMFELKQAHSKNCDAENVRRYHEEHCDADGIDTASR